MSTARTTTPAVLVALVAALLLAACSSGGSEGAADASATPSTAGTSASTTTLPPPVRATPEADAEEDRLVAARPVEVHLPKGYREDRPAPLAILLHGYGVSGGIQAAYLRMATAADDAGVIWAAPDGTLNRTGSRFWNATDACCAGPLLASAPDDSAYLTALVHHIEREHAVDARRVFLIGHSNGGFMSYRMACDHADEIAAIASLEAATFDDPSRCRPSEPVAVLEVHGTADRTIPYEGGRIAGATYPGAEETVRTWARYDGCRNTPDRPAPKERQIVQQKPPATVTAWSRCRPGGHVELWTQPDGSHIPAWTSDFTPQVLTWLLAHPKPA